MKELFEAIRDSDIVKLTALLQNPEVVTNINTYKSANNRHVLHYAVEQGATPAVIAALVTAGADINKQSHGNQTPLIFAIMTESQPAVEQLIALGANVNQPGGQGLPALAYAAIENNTGVMALLLAAGANVDKAGHHGATALEMAARSGSLTAIKMLLDAGASITDGLVAAKGDMPVEARDFLDAQIRGRGVAAKLEAIDRHFGHQLPAELMKNIAYRASGVKKRSSSNTYRRGGARRRTHKARRH
jgi:hypothetical protein